MDSTPEGILNAALAREEASYQFYEVLLERHSKVEPVRKLIEDLKNEEFRHIRMIREMMTKLDLGHL